MAITHQYQGQLRRVQLMLLGAFIIALVVVSIVWGQSSPPQSVSNDVTHIVTTHLVTEGFKSDLFQVKVKTSARQPAWALFYEIATTKGEATFQNTYGVAHDIGGNWKMVTWGTALVGCEQDPAHSAIPAVVMRDLGMACPSGWN
jgi:hypothetical protein